MGEDEEDKLEETRHGGMTPMPNTSLGHNEEVPDKDAGGDDKDADDAVVDSVEARKKEHQCCIEEKVAGGAADDEDEEDVDCGCVTVQETTSTEVDLLLLV